MHHRMPMGLVSAQHGQYPQHLRAIKYYQHKFAATSLFLTVEVQTITLPEFWKQHILLLLKTNVK
jgi:hypothetical protein